MEKTDATNNIEHGKGRKRRSSILKIHNDGIEPEDNDQGGGSTGGRRIRTSRRVSFAEKKIVTQFDHEFIGISLAKHEEPALHESNSSNETSKRIDLRGQSDIDDRQSSVFATDQETTNGGDQTYIKSMSSATADNVVEKPIPIAPVLTNHENLSVSSINHVRYINHGVHLRSVNGTEEIATSVSTSVNVVAQVPFAVSNSSASGAEVENFVATVTSKSAGTILSPESMELDTTNSTRIENLLQTRNKTAPNVNAIQQEEFEMPTQLQNESMELTENADTTQNFLQHFAGERSGIALDESEKSIDLRSLMGMQSHNNTKCLDEEGTKNASELMSMTQVQTFDDDVNAGDDLFAQNENVLVNENTSAPQQLINTSKNNQKHEDSLSKILTLPRQSLASKSDESCESSGRSIQPGIVQATQTTGTVDFFADVNENEDELSGDESAIPMDISSISNRDKSVLIAGAANRRNANETFNVGEILQGEDLESNEIVEDENTTVKNPPKAANLNTLSNVSHHQLLTDITVPETLAGSSSPSNVSEWHSTRRETSTLHPLELESTPTNAPKVPPKSSADDQLTKKDDSDVDFVESLPLSTEERTSTPCCMEQFVSNSDIIASTLKDCDEIDEKILSESIQQLQQAIEMLESEIPILKQATNSTKILNQSSKMKTMAHEQQLKNHCQKLATKDWLKHFGKQMLEVAQSNVNEMQKQHKNALAKLQTEKIAVSVELPLLETEFGTLNSDLQALQGFDASTIPEYVRILETLRKIRTENLALMSEVEEAKINAESRKYPSLLASMDLAIADAEDQIKLYDDARREENRSNEIFELKESVRKHFCSWKSIKFDEQENFVEIRINFFNVKVFFGDRKLTESANIEFHIGERLATISGVIKPFCEDVAASFNASQLCLPGMNCFEALRWYVEKMALATHVLHDLQLIELNYFDVRYHAFSFEARIVAFHLATEIVLHLKVDWITYPGSLECDRVEAPISPRSVNCNEIQKFVNKYFASIGSNSVDDFFVFGVFKELEECMEKFMR